MDYTEKFESNVKSRLRDVHVAQRRQNKPADMRAASLFFGVALGVVAARVACLSVSI